MQLRMKIPEGQDSLFRRAGRGDTNAFVELLRSCQTELEKYIAARIGGAIRSKVEADDVLQETCFRALQSISRAQWRGKDTFVRWLKGIARHVILQQAGRAGLRELIYLTECQPAEEPSPSRILRRKDRFDRLRAAIDQLPPAYREAVVLVRIEGLQIKEAAKRMDRTPKAVMHLLSRGLKRLKELLADTESLGLPPDRIEKGQQDDA